MSWSYSVGEHVFPEKTLTGGHLEASHRQEKSESFDSTEEIWRLLDPKCEKLNSFDLL